MVHRTLENLRNLEKTEDLEFQITSDPETRGKTCDFIHLPQRKIFVHDIHLVALMEVQEFPGSKEKLPR